MKIIIGVFIYVEVLLIVFGLLGNWPLLAIAGIFHVINKITTRHMTDDEILEAMGTNWLEKIL